MMQDLMVRIPHLSEQIFQKLNHKSLFKCREAARSWQNIIDGRNYPWLRIVNIPTILKRRNTYLHLSAKTGQIEVFKIGLNKEGDKNIQNELGETPFHYACQNRRLKMVEFLLQNNDLEIGINSKDNHVIDLNAKTKCGNTALCYACFKGHADVVKILMKNASYLSIDDAWKGFYWACQEGHSDVVKILIENATILSINFNIGNNDGTTAFHKACERGFSDVVKIIMENAAILSIDLNRTDNEGLTGLHWACLCYQSNVVKAVINSEISNHFKEKKQLTPSSIILESALRIDLNRKDKYGDTAFHYLCLTGNSELVNIFIENAAILSLNFNIRNNDGMTAFHIVCDSGFSDAVEIIMENAATLNIDLNRRDKNGHTAFYLAYKKDKSDVVKIITKNAADLSNWCISL